MSFVNHAAFPDILIHNEFKESMNHVTHWLSHQLLTLSNVSEKQGLD